MLQDIHNKKNDKQIAIWLLIGVGMIVIQVLLGGITRLTESGLSITEWKPITGALPPMNNADWQIEFEKYRQTDQFKYVHASFSLSDFKFIFFWEWFHRLWARAMGLVFIIGFLYFLLKRKFNKGIVLLMLILFLLGALQGTIGWMLVNSGLVPEKFFVGHIELTTHLIAALLLLCYTLWFALSKLDVVNSYLLKNDRLKKMILLISCFVFVQLIFGGFMAGLKAAATAPTWPSINGSLVPEQMNELHPWVNNIIHNNLMIHFIHRGIGYTLFILVCIFYYKSRSEKSNALFSKASSWLFFLICLQVILGICTLLNATNPHIFVWLGVIHQLVAMFIVICLTLLLYLSRSRFRLN